MVAIFGFGAGAYWVLFNLYLKSLGYGEGFIGQIMGLIALGSMVGTIPIAWLCGRMPIKWVLIISILVNVIGDVFLLAADVEWVVKLGAVVSGMSFVGWMTATAPFIMRNASVDQRGRIFSYKHGAHLLTSGLASLGFALTVDWLVGRGNLQTDAYLWVLMAASLCKLLAAGLGLLLNAQSPLPEERRNLREFIMARDWSALIKLGVPMMLIGFGAGMTMPFLNLYFQQRFNLETGSIGILFFVCTLCMAAGTLYGPKIALKRGNIRTVIITQFLSLPFMLILALTGNIGLALTAFFFRATLMNMGHPLYRHFAMEMVERKEQATTNAFQSLSWNAGWLCGSWLGGLSIELHGFTPTILATAGCYLLATLIQIKMFTKTPLLRIGRESQV